jgi:hypothetical protein
MNSSATKSTSPIVRANQARREATNKLIESHQDEYNAYLKEERVKRNLSPMPGDKPPTMKEQLAEKETEIERLRRALLQYGVDPDERSE